MTNKNYYWILFRSGEVERTWDRFSSEDIKQYGCGVTHYQVSTGDTLKTPDESKWIAKKEPVVSLDDLRKEVEDAYLQYRNKPTI